MKQTRLVFIVVLCCLALSGLMSQAFGASAAILGWNNLGMHCMDSDYSVFSILPPYNTIEAQLLVGGKLVQSGSGYTVSYEAVADPDGSINSTSIGKGTWGQFANALYGLPASAGADTGLAGWNMPGIANVPQQMRFETYNAPAPGVSTPVNWFRAEGIPLTPIDDKGNKNSYPLMRLVARDASNTVIARSDIVLPVSDEMDCSVCHSSGTMAAAQPAAGWVFASTKDRDYRLNIIRLHDESQFAKNGPLYRDALAAKGLDAKGLYATVAAGRPILCATCHASEALGTASFASANGSVPPLTTSMHTEHATVQDPVLNVTLNDATNRNACYRCHPGSATRCLRGAMGSAIAADGSMAMQCQSCHGSVSQVGSSSRVGWFMEPNCQSCHTGTAVKNSGQIRYTSALDGTGLPRIPADQTFATSADTPAPGLSLYRFSVGHGGLQCSACHGSTHAEFPSSHRNDNIRNVQLQGHGGTTVECTACHATTPYTANGGPHGMHPVGQSWVSGHHDMISSVGVASCKACHGTDYRGTVLSRMQANRTMSLGDFGSQTFFRGATIGCYTCHQGPSSSSFNSATAPTVANVTGSGVSGMSVSMKIPVTGTNAVLRIVSQPANGTVGLVNGVATYFPGEGFTGTDTFTFAAYDGAKNSNLGTGTVTIAPGAPVITQNPASVTVTAGSAASFAVAASGSAPLSYQWYKSGAAIAGATTPVLSIPSATSANAGSYYAVVNNNAGSATSTVAVLTVVYPTPAISGFTPASGPAGTWVTINGANLVGVSQVKFNGVNASFSEVSASQLSAIVPLGAATGPVSITTANGTATSTGSFSVTGTPVVSGFTPGYGGVGTAVTVTGSNLTGATSVKFNGVAAPCTVISGTTLVTGVPAGATSGRITVTTAAGSATSSSSFSVSTKAVAPRIKSFSPSSGRVGTAVTVTGTNLGGITSARIGGVNAPFTVLAAGKVVLTVPTGAKSGRISMTTAGGTGTSSASFTVLP